MKMNALSRARKWNRIRTYRPAITHTRNRTYLSIGHKIPMTSYYIVCLSLFWTVATVSSFPLWYSSNSSWEGENKKMQESFLINRKFLYNAIR